MTVEQHIEEIRAGIRLGRFPNEAAVSLGIVLRLLNSLGWPTWDVQVVWPEYSVETRRVDFALCHPPTKPLVFVEVKQVGQSDGAERQLFEYAFHKGVPLAILTDGREWSFFLPAEAGDYGERRVYKLDMLDRDPSESGQRLNRYLRFDAVCSGEALKAARDDYQDVARSRQISQTLPEAWRKLVEDEDEYLIDVVADQAENLCGYKPDPDTVARFLKEDLLLWKRELRPPVPPPPPVPPLPGTIGFRFRGRFHSCKNAREVLVGAIETLSDVDPAFISRFASLPKHGRTRRYIAVNKAELYPGRPDLAEEHSHHLRSGYWLGINASRNAIERILRMACEVAGCRYGSDLKVGLG